jgi:F-type H+-transporting ATPase subunit a
LKDVTFFQLLGAPRTIAALVLLALAAWFSGRHAEHHTSENPFELLYLHLMPAKLLADPHAAHADAAHADAAHADAAHADAAHADAAHADAAHAEHAAPADAEHASGEHATGEHAPEYLLDLALPFGGPHVPVLLPEGFDMDPGRAGTQLVLTNLQVFQVLAVVLVLLCFSGVPRYLRTGQGDALTRVLAGFAQWVRDEMVYRVMGEHHGRAFVPWFLCIFFFVLFMNLCGLVPYAATATAAIHVTMALAVITFCSMIICGMVVQGPIAFWKHLVPQVPLVLWPLMFLVEVIGLVVKPFALMIRLFANLTGGHLVVLSFMGLIFYFGQLSAGVGLAVSPMAVALAVFIMIIEAFVALLQAFVFTQLSILFVNASVHPEH